MGRADDGLPFLLQYENVARYEDGNVIILDRTKYPMDIEYVTCKDYKEVAKAIRDMVTQSGGPYWAAAFGMVSVARSVVDLPPDQAIQELRKAAEVLANARVTTKEGMRKHIDKILNEAEKSVLEKKDPEKDTLDFVKQIREIEYLKARKIGENTVSLFPDDPVILTQCFADDYIGFTLLVALEQGKKISLFVPETRPYLQGSRLTASVAYDLGIPVTVITDNIPGLILSRHEVDVFISAADVITTNGYVVNKIGTYQIALVAHHSGIPYYVQGEPSPAHPDISSVEIEERDPEEALHFRGIRTTKEGVKGYYPAFDITPPNLVSAVISSKGIFSPYDLINHF
jgi:methylthioribose-1-phosphate isomerase